MTRRITNWVTAILIFFIADPAQAMPPPTLSGSLEYDAVSINHGPDQITRVHDWRRRNLILSWAPRESLILRAGFNDISKHWGDVFVQWTTHYGSWRVGQFDPPFGLEKATSDKHWLFMESSVSQLFGIKPHIGADYRWDSPDWSLSVASFGQDLSGRFEGRGAAARLTWTPIIQSEAERIWHVGASLASERPNHPHYSLRTRPETHLARLRFSGPGRIDKVESVNRAGFETGLIQGPWLLQGEVSRLQVSREDGPDINATGGYLSLARVLTGQRHGYKQGVIIGVDPGPGQTALEVAIRYSRIDFEGLIPEDGQTAWTAGLNWYFRRDCRLMLNYVTAQRRGGNRQSPHILEARVQFAF